MSADKSSDASTWSRDQDKQFENALVTYSEDLVDRWEKIAAAVPGKSMEEVKHHYELLVDDIKQIESGCVPLPWDDFTSDVSMRQTGDEETGKKGSNSGDSNHGGKGSKSDQERRKGIAWTEDEHKLFLLGLAKYGKGDWRSISRNYVVTRNPTQVASHAQKYYIRLNSMNKDRRRSSIHDITSVHSPDYPVPQGPITGQTNDSPAGSSSSKQIKQPTQSPAAPSLVGIYGGTAIGQPVGGPLISAVGTPVNLTQAPHMAHGSKMLMAPPMSYPCHTHLPIGEVHGKKDCKGGQ